MGQGGPLPAWTLPVGQTPGPWGTVIILLSLVKQCSKGNPGQWRAGSEERVGHGSRAPCRVWEQRKWALARETDRRPDT